MQRLGGDPCRSRVGEQLSSGYFAGMGSTPGGEPSDRFAERGGLGSCEELRSVSPGRLGVPVDPPTTALTDILTDPPDNWPRFQEFKSSRFGSEANY